MRAKDVDKKGMLKVDLHVHTAADPVDNLPLDIVATIERAASFGYDAIALTHHDAYYKMTDEAREASERTGVLVLSGVEATLDDNGHCLIVNCGSEVEGIQTLDDLADVRKPEHLIVAAHPYYPGFGMGGALLEKYDFLFDGVEWSHFWNQLVSRPNMKAFEFCRRNGKALVGTGDIHLPDQMNRTYALIRAEKDPASITQAIRDGQVELVTEPLTIPYMVGLIARLTWHNQLTSTKFWKQLGRQIAGDGSNPFGHGGHDHHGGAPCAHLGLTPLRA